MGEKDGINPEGSMKDVDWAAMWHRQLARATFRGEGAAFWDRWARTFPNKNGRSAYVEEVLRRLHLEPRWSVLDVGAGMGALTVPLAREGHPVTAVDHSTAMLEVLAGNAAREGLDNICPVILDWTRARVGEDFPVHDAVLVSRSLPSGSDIARSLRLIDRAARRACFITWKADAYNELEAGICELLGIEYSFLPEYTVLYNLLYSLGIYASVEIFRIDSRWEYRSLDDAFTQLVRSRPVDEARTRERIMEYLAGKLSFQDGYYRRSRQTIWALFSWRK